MFLRYMGMRGCGFLVPDPGIPLEGSRMTKLMTHREGRSVVLICCLLFVFVGIVAVQGQEPERKILKKVEAKYPDLLKKKGIGGTVRLKAIVKADGSVKSVD